MHWDLDNKLKLGISGYFSAAHFLPRYKGKCENMHGHTYRVDLVVKGEKKEDSEFVADFAEVKAFLKEVLSKLDHKLLNEMIDYPTSENIALFIKKEVEKSLAKLNLGVTLYSIKVWEGKDKWVMVDGCNT